jgi:SAM-dependent methyltransferase
MPRSPPPEPVPGFAALRRRRGETRSIERLRAHYDLEVQLARRLMNAPKAQRASAYRLVYDELLAGIPDHPQHARRQSADRAHVDAQLRELRRLLGNAETFLEIGAGDCRVSFAVCGLVRRVIAVDLSDRLVSHEQAPANFSFVPADGTSIPVAAGSVCVAYSHQLIEHLHPDDALEQLKSVHRALRRGGVYYCVTPSRITGPHDISGYFDDVARGLHLREYTYRELTPLLRRAGFRRIRYGIGRLGQSVPAPLLFGIEAALDRAPGSWRSALCRNPVAARLLGIHAFAYK